MESLSTLFPTDNLYKFLAITGIVIAGLSLYYPTTKAFELRRNLANLKGEVEVLRLEQEFLTEDTDKITEEIGMLEKQSTVDSTYTVEYEKANDIKIYTANEMDYLNLRTNILRKKSERDYYEFLFKYDNELNPTRKRLREASEKNNKVMKIAQEILVKGAKIKKNTELISLEEESYTMIKKFGEIGFLLGLIISIFGFIKWYFVLQSPQDQIASLQLQELKDKLGVKK